MGEATYQPAFAGVGQFFARYSYGKVFARNAALVCMRPVSGDLVLKAQTSSFARDGDTTRA